MGRRVVICAVGLLTWAFEPTAHAQASESKAAGRALFDEGMHLFERGEYAEACPKFAASLAHYPGVGTRGKLAECYAKIGRTASAWSLYREVAILAGRAGDRTREQIATERAQLLEPKLARITIRIADGAEVPGLQIKRDGEPLAQGEIGSAVAVDPREIFVSAMAPGRKAWSAVVRVAEGRTEIVEVPVLEIEPTPAPKAQVPADGGGSLIVPPRIAAPTGLGWQRTTGIAAGGVGLATALVGGYFGLSAKSTYDDAFDRHCSRGDNTCDADGQRETEKARDKAVVATVLVGTGAALMVTGAVLFFTAPKRDSGRAIQVVPSVGPGVAGIAVSGKL